MQVESVDPFTIAFYRFIGIALPAYSILIYRGEVCVFSTITIITITITITIVFVKMVIKISVCMQYAIPL